VSDRRGLTRSHAAESDSRIGSCRIGPGRHRCKTLSASCRDAHAKQRICLKCFDFRSCIATAYVKFRVSCSNWPNRSVPSPPCCRSARRGADGHRAANRVPAHKMHVIRLTITESRRRPCVYQKMVPDLQYYFCYRSVIGSLPNRDIRFPKMTNAIGSRTVPVSPNRVMESNQKLNARTRV
jgi:hypothetical protein